MSLPKVNLTQRLTKCQADPKQYHSWPLDASTGGQGVMGWGVGEMAVYGEGGISGKGWPNVKLTKVVSLLATRCLYWETGDDMVDRGCRGQWGHIGMGVHLTKADQMSSWSKLVSLLATRCLNWGGQEVGWRWGVESTFDQKSTWPQGWPNVSLIWCSTTLGH